MFKSDTNYKEFAKNYNLEVIERTCECGNLLISDQPYYRKGFAGLNSKGCKTCNITVLTEITITKEASAKWFNLISPFLG